MERASLELLEKRVDALRIVVAEKAVLARSLDRDAEPPRHHGEISTAILALVVFVAFLGAREVGMFVASGASCPALDSDAYATLSYDSGSRHVTLDTNGRVRRSGQKDEHVTRKGARYVIDRLARTCFLDRPPKDRISGSQVMVTLRVGRRQTTYTYDRGRPPRLCGDDLDAIEHEFWTVVDQGID